MSQFTFTPVEPPAPIPRDPIPLPQAGSRFGKAHHILLIFTGLALIAWLLSGIYKVNADQVAIVERLGKFVSTNPQGKADLIGPGLHYHLPWPIDTAYVVSIRQTRNLVVDIFNSTPDAYEEVKRNYIRDHPGIQIVLVNSLFDPYLVTGDNNVVNMQVAVQYTIDDPEAWITTASHEDSPAETEGMRELIFQQVIQHAMVHMVSTLSIDDILFQGRDRLRPLLMNAITDALQLPDPDDPTHTRRINPGLHVEQVDLVEARPPVYVRFAFDQVTSARAQMVSKQTQARARANSAITAAKNEAQTLIGDAEAYRKQTVDAATGEASRFALVLEQYNRNPDVTRFNLYTDAIRTITAAANRVLFVQPGQQTTLTIDPPQFDAGQVQPNP